jgi:predicted DNA-binding transcriptional regulator YafY
VDVCSLAIQEFSGNQNGVQRRQVLDDIRFMESEQGWSIPLVRFKDGKRVYYRYENSDYSINKQPLNEADKIRLREVLFMLSRFKGMPQFEWVGEILARFEADSLLPDGSARIMEFDHNFYLRGLDFIDPLFYAILYQKAVKITYQSFRQSKPGWLVLHPYFLKQYNSRWYILGRHDESGKIINLALDRIKAIGETSTSYIRNLDIDFTKYFEDIVGVTRHEESEVTVIELEVHNDLLPYLETKPLHGSQKKIKRRENHTNLILELIPNYELESLLLSFGEKLQVLAPESLRLRMKERLEAAFKKYM